MTTDKTPATLADSVDGWPEHLMIRDTGLADDMGGLGQRIFTTAGAGYMKKKYIREDLASSATLATVKHGGCVQLPIPERERFEAWAEGNNYEMEWTGLRYVEEATQDAWLAWQAALSAQPSPGGQGDALEALVADWEARPGITDAYRICAAELKAALAARQPVGEPVADWSKRGGKPTDWRNELLTLAAHHGPIPAFARSAMRVIALSMPTPPAQAVDLAMPIAMIDQALGRLSTTLDDLQSSPDRRPAVMVAEAIGCLHQALMGIPHG